MKIFISWSGERSKAIANILYDWLPLVIQTAKPWLSASDIDKGTRWSTDIATQLEETSFGIICLTPENLEAPWIHFEAGALSKTIDGSFVCPYLYEIEPTDIEGPLVQFQSTSANKDDTKKLIHTINNALPESMTEQQIDKAFEVWWKDLKEKLEGINPIVPHPAVKRTERELLEEILELARGQARGSRIGLHLDEELNERIGGNTDLNIDWPIGTSVRHSLFGEGVIRNTTGMGSNAVAYVFFKKVGLKKLVLEYAKLEKI